MGREGGIIIMWPLSFLFHFIHIILHNALSIKETLTLFFFQKGNFSSNLPFVTQVFIVVNGN
jgi:hypothetical protein